MSEDKLGKKIEEGQSAIQRLRRDPRLEIKTETYQPGQDNHAHATELVLRAGKVLAPSVGKYVGSAVVHLYEMHGGRQMQFVTQCPFTQAVNEIQAGFAMDELRRKLMANFERKPHGR